MPKDDITRRAVVRTAGILNSALARISEVVPLGPERVELSRSEVVDRLAREPSKEFINELLGSMGPEETLSLMKEAHGKQTRPQIY